MEEETVIWMVADFHSLFGTRSRFSEAGGRGPCFHISSKGLTNCSIPKLSSVLGNMHAWHWLGRQAVTTQRCHLFKSPCLAAFSQSSKMGTEESALVPILSFIAQIHPGVQWHIPPHASRSVIDSYQARAIE